MKAPGRSFSGSETTTWARLPKVRSRAASGYICCRVAMSAEWNRLRVWCCEEYRKAHRGARAPQEAHRRNGTMRYLAARSL